MEFTLEKFSTFNDKGRIKGKRSQYVTFEFAGNKYNMWIIKHDGHKVGDIFFPILNFHKINITENTPIAWNIICKKNNKSLVIKYYNPSGYKLIDEKKYIIKCNHNKEDWLSKGVYVDIYENKKAPIQLVAMHFNYDFANSIFG